MRPTEMDTGNTTSSPHLSLVVAGRNDNHGGAMLERTNAFLDTWRQLALEEGLRSEIVLVEWNPVPGEPGMAEVVEWPKTPGVDLRIITVPESVHDALPTSDEFQFFQMIGKNVGARRARGEWVLFTNLDVLFNRPMIRLLKHGELDPKAFYRTTRWDCGERIIPMEFNADERIAFCEKHLVRVNANGKTVETEGVNIPATSPEALTEPAEIAALLQKGENRPLFSNACGDFTLLHRDAVEALRGYPELPYWSIFIDGLLIHAALGHGLRQVEIGDPARMFHIEHGRGWAVDKVVRKKEFTLDYRTMYKPWARALKEGHVGSMNPPDWGFARLELPETVFRAPVHESVALEERA